MTSQSCPEKHDHVFESNKDNLFRDTSRGHVFANYLVTEGKRTAFKRWGISQVCSDKHGQLTLEEKGHFQFV